MAAPMDCHALRNISQNLARADCYETFNSTIHDIFDNYKPFSSTKSGQELVTIINKCLGTSGHRLRGLNLLLRLIEQCSPEIFADNTISWSNRLLEILQSYDSGLCHQMALYAFARIFSFGPEFSDVSRSLSSGAIPQLLASILNSTTLPSNESAVITCLKSCLTNFAAPCGNAKTKIERLLLRHLLDDGGNYREIATDCYALLPGCGGGGHLGIKHSDSWRHQTDKVVATMNALLRLLFSAVNFEDDDEDSSDRSKVISEFFELPEEEPVKMLTLTHRFRSLNLCLKKLLTSRTEFVVKVPIDDIIDFISRCLAVNGKTLIQRPTTERLFLAGVIVDIHCDILACLEALILTCRGDALAHSRTINRMIVQCLRWTAVDSVAPSGQTKPLASLRISSYGAWSTWMIVTGQGCGTEKFADELLEYIAQDMKPADDAWVMKSNEAAPSSAQNSKRGSNKRRKKSAPETTTAAVKKIDARANLDLCSAALKCLKSLLTSASCSLKPKHLGAIDEMLTVEILTTQQNSSSGLYASAVCRYDLYDALKASVLVSHPKYGAPISCAVRLFSAGRRDECPRVVALCQEAVAICNAIVHPRAPVIGGPRRATRPDEPNDAPESESVFVTRRRQQSKRPIVVSDEEAEAERPSAAKERKVETSNEDDLIELTSTSRTQDVAMTTSGVDEDVAIDADPNESSSDDEDGDDAGSFSAPSKNKELVKVSSAKRDSPITPNVVTQSNIASVTPTDTQTRLTVEFSSTKEDDVTLRTVVTPSNSAQVTPSTGSSLPIDTAGSDDAATDEMLAAFVDAGPDSD